MELNLLKHQAEFIADTSTRNLALVGGYGCGKTMALATKLVVLALMNPGYVGIALSPTFPMATKVLVPTIEDTLREHNIDYTFNKSELLFKIKTGPRTETKLFILSAENYKRAAGINAAFFGIDEGDLMDMDTFIASYQMLSSRLRKGLVYQGVVVSTPEGFKGVHKFFVEEVITTPALGKDRKLIKASTYDNPFLPKEYIEGLENQYPEHLIKAYLMGEFVNLQGATVYWKFDDSVNQTDKTIADFSGQYLHIGQDFNKSINAAVVSVIKDQKVYAIDEIYGSRDTDDLIKEIERRYPWHVQNLAIKFYPDASGFEGIQQLRRKFGDANVRHPASNPKIERRVAAVNEKFKPYGRAAEAFINKDKCPMLYKGITQQIFDHHGLPDKKAGIDHQTDAFGYFINYQFPVAGKVTARID